MFPRRTLQTLTLLLYLMEIKGPEALDLVAEHGIKSREQHYCAHSSVAETSF